MIGQRRMDLPEDTMIFDIDSRAKDPLLCPQIANDLFKNLQSYEEKTRPRADYMEKVQKLINPRARRLCVDWLVSAAEELCLASDTWHLAINCLDRYLSGNEADTESLFLSGLTCLLIASKYIELQTDIEVDLYISFAYGKFSREDFIHMEKSILNYLDYDVASPTTWSFLGRFVRAAKAGKGNLLHLHGLENMACYLAELSLLSYTMLQFRPSMVAASCVFLAQYIRLPWKKPWNETLQYYTHYQPSDMRDCILELHAFCYEMQLTATPPIIKIKYCQPNRDCVALQSFPSYVHFDLFQSSNF